MKKIFTKTIANDEVVNELSKLSWTDINKLSCNLGLRDSYKNSVWNCNIAVYVLNEDEKITPQLLRNLNIVC